MFKSERVRSQERAIPYGDSTTYRGVLTDDVVQAVNERNLARATKARVALGNKYICHPKNRVFRNPKLAFAKPIGHVRRKDAK